MQGFSYSYTSSFLVTTIDTSLSSGPVSISMNKEEACAPTSLESPEIKEKQGAKLFMESYIEAEK